MSDAIRIRPARAGDVPRLPAIELAAGARFRSVGLDGPYLDEATEEADLAAGAREARLFVAVDAADAPIGFALATLPDGRPHLEELDVHPDWNGRGLGRRLVDVVCAWARARGADALTLCTFSDVPWNAPWYERLGFVPIAAGTLPPGLRALRANEEADGLPMERRVVMRLALDTAAQRWDPEGYARHARFVSDLGAPVLELLAPQPGERVLDLGCGDGVLTARLVDAGCRVIGVDGSAAFVAAARERGIDARRMDGQALAFDGEFDAVFSNAAMHWMGRADDVIAGVRRALVPGGRFVGEFGGHGCVARVVEGLAAALAARGIDAATWNPWYFPTDGEYRARLDAGGFDVRWIALLPRPTPLPGDVVAWLETFAQCFTSALPEVERPAFLEDVRERLRPHLCDAEGRWTADYVRLRFAAERRG